MTSDVPLIGLSGYARSGKDTVASVLADHGFRRVGFADSLREVALALDPTIEASSHARSARLSTLISVYGWEYSKDAWPDVRRVLQRLGTEVGRKFFGDNVWVDLALAKVTGPTVFTDCRFPNEAAAIRSRGGEVWRVKRPGFGPVNAHPSETGLDDYAFSCVILNDSTLDDLAAQVRLAATTYGAVDGRIAG
ncbi:MAG: hypothetical protein ACRDRL_12350 [Sciscionella sp.]